MPTRTERFGSTVTPAVECQLVSFPQDRQLEGSSVKSFVGRSYLLKYSKRSVKQTGSYAGFHTSLMELCQLGKRRSVSFVAVSQTLTRNNAVSQIQLCLSLFELLSNMDLSAPQK